MKASTLLVACTAFVLSTTGCRQSTDAVCVEGLCFTVPLHTGLQSREHKHTVRPFDLPGWIDVQAFTPLENAPTEVTQLTTLFADRHTLAGAVHLLRSQTATVLNRTVPMIEYTIRFNNTEYHRRSYLLASTDGTPWRTIDLTSPSAEWNVAEAALAPVITTMTAATPRL